MFIATIAVIMIITIFIGALMYLFDTGLIAFIVGSTVVAFSWFFGPIVGDVSLLIGYAGYGLAAGPVAFVVARIGAALLEETRLSR